MNVDPGLLGLIAFVTAVILVGIVYWRSGRPVTVEGVVGATQSALPIAQDVETVLKMVVVGVEQLKENGDIKTDGEAFQKAFAVARKHDLLKNIDPEVVEVWVEGAYRLFAKKPDPPAPRTEGQLLADLAEQQLLTGPRSPGSVP